MRHNEPSDIHLCSCRLAHDLFCESPAMLYCVTLSIIHLKSSSIVSHNPLSAFNLFRDIGFTPVCSETVEGWITLCIMCRAATTGVLGLHGLQVNVNIDFQHLEEVCDLWPRYLDCVLQL